MILIVNPKVYLMGTTADFNNQTGQDI